MAFAWWGWIFFVALPLLVERWLRDRETERIDALVEKFQERHFPTMPTTCRRKTKEGGGR